MTSPSKGANGGERPVQIDVRGLYKIFGPRADEMLQHVRAGIGKAELLAEHNHVLGLQDINVKMRSGDVTVVMGLSGSGKSTLIRHLNRLIEPTAGELIVDGNDVMQLGPEKLRQMRQTKMSMVFQKFALLPHRTVEQNAAMALEIRGEPEAERIAEGRKWLSRVGLEGYEAYYPHQLSGGMQQRVGIARALTSNSDIMLMDEA
jgi:glycine betaine/proline transport system ATP-binding protein